MAADIELLLSDLAVLGPLIAGAGLLVLRVGYFVLRATIAMIAVLSSKPDRRAAAAEVLRLLLPRRSRDPSSDFDQERSSPPNP